MEAEAVQKPERVLVIGAHPDDLEFGCAGTMALWARQGKEIFYLLSTRGDKGTPDSRITPEELAALRESEQVAAAKVVGVREVTFLDFRDGELKYEIPYIGAVVRAIRTYKPDIVFCPDPLMYWREGYINHPDHRICGEVAMAAVFPYARDRLHFNEQIEEGLDTHKVKEVYLFFTDKPNTWVDICETLDVKIEALKQHYTQVGEWDQLPEMIKLRAAQAGEEKGIACAESFHHIVLRS